MNNNPRPDQASSDDHRIPVKDITPVKVHRPEKNASSSAKNHIYVRQVKGKIENFRQLFGGFFILIFAAIPWISIEGQQAILFDIMEQRFHIFGLTLWPQDLTLLAVIFMIGAYALFFVTTFAGRVWCGFMCPQTTFTYIYIWFEHKIEGPHNKRIKLDEREMDLDKFLRKFAKHFCWLAVALLTSLTFVGYFSPVRDLFADFFTLQASGLAVSGVLFFTFCTYGNAGWMREIMCTHMCPYARFQSVMFDADTLMVAYDEKRGEGRGPRSRKMAPETLKEKGLGDCIDCNMCVQVCPTGIDIRNGLQYECINCGACIDACNGVMEKMNYAKGLISFTSEHALQGKKVHILRPKIIGYAVVLVLMTLLLAVQIWLRVPLEVDIIRDRGLLFRETSEGLVENVYTLKILNKHQNEQLYTIKVEGFPGAKFIGQQTVMVKGAELETVPISIAVNPYEIHNRVTEINFRVTNEDGSIEVLEPSKFHYR